MECLVYTPSNEHFGMPSALRLPALRTTTPMQPVTPDSADDDRGGEVQPPIAKKPRKEQQNVVSMQELRKDPAFKLKEAAAAKLRQAKKKKDGTIGTSS